MTILARLSPLEPIFDPGKRKGSIDPGGTPSTTPPPPDSVPSEPTADAPYQYEWVDSFNSIPDFIRKINDTEFLVACSGGFRRLNTASVTGPTTVTEIDSLDIASHTVFGSVSEVDTADGALFIASDGSFDKSVDSFDVIPTSSVSHVDDLGIDSDFSGMPAFISHDHAADVLYVPRTLSSGTGEPLLVSIDTSNRSALAELDRLDSTAVPELLGNSNCALSDDGGTLYVSLGSGRLARVNVSNPSSMSYIDRSATNANLGSSGTTQLQGYGGDLYELRFDTNTSETSIVKWDISGTPSVASVTGIGSGATAGLVVHAPSGIAYVGYTNGIQTWDLSGVTPSLVSTRTGTGWGSSLGMVMMGAGNEYLVTLTGLGSTSDPDINVFQMQPI